MEEHPLAIGIDLGYTSATVAIFHPSLPSRYSSLSPPEGSVLHDIARPFSPTSAVPQPVCRSFLRACEIIPDRFGNRNTPSVIKFTHTSTNPLSGAAASHFDALSPENTFRGMKRLIGKEYCRSGNNCVGCAWKELPFTVRSGEHDQLLVEVVIADKKQLLSAEEITSHFLIHLKDLAECWLGARVTRAVVSVPALFSDSQRRATRNACRMAGLDVLRLINDPTAAVFSYGVDQLSSAEKHILLFDLGGGSLDVAVITCDEGVFETIAAAGDPLLGGEDFTSKLVAHCAEEFKREHCIDLRKSPRAMCRLRAHCERAKRHLSSAQQTVIDVQCLESDLDFRIRVSRAHFEDMCQDLFERAIQPVRAALQACSLPAEGLHEIVVLGGASRMPKIQSLLQSIGSVASSLPPEKPSRQLNLSLLQSDAVAVGAAIQAAVLTDTAPKELSENMIVLDATSYAIGIGVVSGRFVALVPRNALIPCKAVRVYSTYHDGSCRSFSVDLFETVRAAEFTRDTHRMARVKIDGVPIAPRGVPQIEVTFEVNADGILVVSALDKTGGANRSLPVERAKDHLLPTKTVTDRRLELEQRSCVEARDIEEARAKLEDVLWAALRAVEAERRREGEAIGDQAGATQHGGGTQGLSLSRPSLAPSLPEESASHVCRSDGEVQDDEDGAHASGRAAERSATAMAIADAAECVERHMVWLLGQVAADASGYDHARCELEDRCGPILHKG